MQLDREYWQHRYANGTDGWDVGAPTTPLATYFDQLSDRGLRILIPGCGRAWEGELLHTRGFRHVWLMDLTGAPFADLLKRRPDFPQDHLLIGDFFDHEGTYDLIIEQTFFCALDPSLRERYVSKMHELLVQGGKLVGVLFDDPQPGPDPNAPPFGGDRPTYQVLLERRFAHVALAPCYNSIAPRAGREAWLVARK